ncbi:MAG: hypothetical protein PVF51_00205 [Nitrospirota bacterium]|jgi:hypothetical protein
MSDLETIARQVANSVLHNVLNVRTVDIFFQRSPGNDNGGDRTVAGLHYQVRAQGFVIQRGVTGNDGRINMPIRGGVSTLELLHGGNRVAEYEVRFSAAALAPVADLRGQKQRLRLLGYQIGHGGPDGNGVDNTPDVMEFERSVLDFQTDESLYNDAVINAAVQNQMTNRAGA